MRRTGPGTRSSALIICLLLAAGSAACGPSNDATARTYDDAVDALRRGDTDSALALASGGLDRAEDGSRDRARFSLLAAEILLFRRQPGEARRLLHPTVPAGAEDLRVRQRQLEGHALIVEGKLDEARSMLAAARQQATALGVLPVALDVSALEGQVLFRLGRWDEAEALLTNALDRAREAGDAYREMVALHTLGMGLLVRERFDEALPYFERVLSFKAYEAYTVYVTALTNDALCNARIGEFDRAVSTLKRAVEIHEQRGSRAYLEQALGELGNTYLLSGQLDEGTTYLARALDVARAANATADAAVWASSLAGVYIERGQWDEAERFHREARSLGGDARVRRFETIREADIAAGRGRAAEAMALYAKAFDEAGQNMTVQWVAEAGMGSLEISRGRVESGARHLEKAIDIVERAQGELRTTDNRLSFSNRLIGLYRQYVDLLVRQGQAERALLVADSSRARVLTGHPDAVAPQRVTSAMLRRTAARINRTLLFYWIGPERSYAWVVTAERIRFVPLSVTGETIDALVRKHQAFIVDSVGDVLGSEPTPGDELFSALVAPLAGLLPHDARLIIVADGALTRLNFETLPVPGARRHYFIEDAEIVVSPSLGLVTGLERIDTGTVRRALLIGDAASADPDYPALRYASAEISGVAETFGGRADVIRGADASPAAYRRAERERFDVVHFTAHAAANAESPLDSAVILSPGPAGYKLYARDVANLPLSADLVTISACRSAGDRTYAGEGLVGFAWAFLRAGARRVIAGLWDVDDRSTADLMTATYERLAAGEPPAAALRAAKLGLIARGGAIAKPYYWAPFQVFAGAAAR